MLAAAARPKDTQAVRAWRMLLTLGVSSLLLALYMLLRLGSSVFGRGLGMPGVLDVSMNEDQARNTLWRRHDR